MKYPNPINLQFLLNSPNILITIYPLLKILLISYYYLNPTHVYIPPILITYTYPYCGMLMGIHDLLIYHHIFTSHYQVKIFNSVSCIYMFRFIFWRKNPPLYILLIYVIILSIINYQLAFHKEVISQNYEKYIIFPLGMILKK